ncbi:hypothetical protein QPM17_09455 [Marinobacter sp. TBZ242]|uniref:Uncharacterized protein n=1 Tax=Marinobacter azerbaijanicus TaxID=3050455 RepID=A0ABT7IE02_9GAMM|nr:hypothetical protein [Marinobacter sp. TBZ242]MDL0431354.1 hypothetical protein [Marinobacter sp. TBZ242]
MYTVARKSVRHAFRTSALALVVLLSACGGDFDEEQSSTRLYLQQGDEVEVFRGDELTSPSEDSRIAVRHEQQGDRKFVTMLAGTAELVRGDYYAQQ